MFRTIVVGNHVRHLTKGASIGTFTSEDVKNCKALAKRKEKPQLALESLAPSIFGHSQEKVALLLMLLGGKEKNLENGTHLRGDINILMLGAHAPAPPRTPLGRVPMPRAARAPSAPAPGPPARSHRSNLRAGRPVDSEKPAAALCPSWRTSRYRPPVAVPPASA